MCEVPLDEVGHDGLSFWEHCVAGSCAGVMEHAAMFPLDTLKTRIQSIHVGAKYRYSLKRAARDILRQEGFLSLYRGLLPAVSSALPAHAAYFSVYEAAKDRLLRSYPEEVSYMLGGAAACVAHDTCSVPFDVVKQRLQEGRLGARCSACQVCVDVCRQEGLGALFRSLPATVAMNVPHQAVHWLVYESAKNATGREIEEQLATDFIVCGAVAGAAAALVSAPFDLVRTRLQLGDTSATNVVRRVLRESGPFGLWRGVKPRILFCAPGAAVTMATYEAVKGVLRGRGDAASAGRPSNGHSLAPDSRSPAAPPVAAAAATPQTA
eukprot:TRINITY_DN50591_c0_g1_i1.p1 TRINITY_DN50591_c0_g1~~TRINITY_DN50591_c0_g1_i1.p1  ORF type:complete len:350 (+),score=94.38 TRINITY_DN50591_c0_g1_i1:83-1051(+)